MTGRQRPLVAGVHGLEHVKRFWTSDLPDDDAVGPHPQGVAHERAQRYLTDTLAVGRSGFEADDVIAGKTELGGVFDGDDSFGGGDLGGQGVEQGRLAGTGTACHQDVAASPHRPREELGHTRRADLPQGDRAGTETANGEVGAVEGEWRHHGVDARSIRQPSVDQRRRPIDPQSQRPHHPLDEAFDGLGVEVDIDALQVAVAFDPHPAGPVHHHLGDVGVGEDGIERSQTVGPGCDRVDEALELGPTEEGHLGPGQALHLAAEAGAVGERAGAGGEHQAMESILQVVGRLARFLRLTQHGATPAGPTGEAEGATGRRRRLGRWRDRHRSQLAPEPRPPLRRRGAPASGRAPAPR